MVIFIITEALVNGLLHDANANSGICYDNLSVCLSVCLSVSVYCVETVNHVTKLSHRRTNVSEAVVINVRRLVESVDCGGM